MSTKIKSGAEKSHKAVCGFFSDFKDFIVKGNMIDLAVGMILGVAFGACVKSLVADIFNPCISLMGKYDMKESFVVLRYGKEANRSKLVTVKQAHDSGAITLNYGRFADTIINLITVGFCLFIVVKLYMLAKKKEEEVVEESTDWPCPRCMEMVKEGATRCPHCSADPISPPPPEATTEEEEAPAEKSTLLA